MQLTNVEKSPVTRFARVLLHRYGWGNKPSLREEKKSARRAFRAGLRAAITHARQNQDPFDPDFDIDYYPSPKVDWEQLD